MRRSEMPDTKNPSIITYNYSVLIYDKMFAGSTEELATSISMYGYPAERDEKIRLYRGSAIKVTDSLGFTKSTGQRCMTLLSGMRCLTLLRPGGHGMDSLYLLHYRPTEEQYNEFKGNVVDTNAKINPSKYQLLLNDIIRLRESYNELAKNYKALDSRLSYLESMAKGQTPE
jgi:hypothetical protein